LNLRLCRDSRIVTYSSLVTHRSNHPKSHHQCHRISNQTPTLPIPPNSLPRILRRVPHIATQSLSALPRRIEPGSLELTRLSWIRILDALTSRRERRRLVDLPDTARTAKTASRYDLNLRAKRRGHHAASEAGWRMGCGCSLGREWDRRDVGGWCGGRCRSGRS
jgi:hypothetical protein